MEFKNWWKECGRMEVTVYGNLGRDAVLRYTPSGTPVLSFSIGSSASKDSPTTWFECTVWGAIAEGLNDIGLSKGNSVKVRGITGGVRKWEKDGVSHEDLQITATEVQRIEKKD